jgi:hypothetical protein
VARCATNGLLLLLLLLRDSMYSQYGYIKVKVRLCDVMLLCCDIY